MAEVREVRDALRAALLEHGYDVQSDTHGTRPALYLMGDGDLALALFEVHVDSGSAIDAMYQGAWTAGLPPRFAVLPEAAKDEISFELLEQMRLVPLLYVDEAGIEFPQLADALAEHL